MACRYKLTEQILASINELSSQRGLLLKTATMVDAILIAAPTSTKNEGKLRDPEMHCSEKGTRRHFGMKAPIKFDTLSGLLRTVRGTSGHVSNIAGASALLPGEKSLALGDASDQGLIKRADARADAIWLIAMRLGKRRALNKVNQANALIDQDENLNASVRAKVEHSFRVIKRQFGFVKVP